MSSTLLFWSTDISVVVLIDFPKKSLENFDKSNCFPIPSKSKSSFGYFSFKYNIKSLNSCS